MPSIIVREYNPTTGAFITNTSSLSFGRVVAGTHSTVKVVDFSFTDVTEISNVNLGLVSAGGVNINDGSTGSIYSDGSAQLGYFGIQHSTTFDPSLATGPLAYHFPGLYDGTHSPDETVTIGTRSNTVSQFIYLDIALGSSNLGAGAGLYKIFFDFT